MLPLKPDSCYQEGTAFDIHLHHIPFAVFLRNYNVDSRTRNMALCHIYHTTADTICLRHSLGSCSTCVVYHSLESRYTCTYVIRCLMLRSLLLLVVPACVPRMSILPNWRVLISSHCSTFLLQELLFPLYKICTLHLMKYSNFPPLTRSILRYSAWCLLPSRNM